VKPSLLAVLVSCALLPGGLAVGRGAPEAGAGPELAITIDDFPGQGPLAPGDTRLAVAKRVIAALKAAGAPPIYGFLNGVRDETAADPGGPSAAAAVAPAWRAAGYPLGNHSWSHMDLHQHSAAEFEADVARTEPVLRREMGAEDWRWFRYPYLREGDTPDKRAQVRRFLGARGYRIAGVTMSFADYAFNAPYVRCAARGDAAGVARLRRAYLQAAAAEAARARAMSRTLLGRDIRYVLLMHLGALDSRLLPELLAQYRREGFRLVTLAEAERDPFYAGDTRPGGPDRPDTLEGALQAGGETAPPAADTAWLDTVCR
jgi:peptidoglycan-N-acetylglucosamine deacetylase